MKAHLEGVDTPAELRFQGREWIAQRIAWVLLAATLAWALLGGFGGGWLARATAGSDVATVRYERWTRVRSSGVLELHVDARGMLRIGLPTAYLADVQLKHVTPPPESVELGAEVITYSFRGTDAPGQRIVRFHLMPERTGRLAGSVVVNGRDPIPFAHLVYP